MAVISLQSAGAGPAAAARDVVEQEGTMEKNKALDAALTQIERAFGKGSIMRMGAKAGDQQIETIPSGSLGLDLALGIGGLPRGRIVEIYGPESSGKTTLALHAIAEAQRRGGTCAFIDAEHALDPIYARKLGVDVDNLLLSQPDGGEQALEICDTLVRSGAVDVLVVDSVAALVPRAELEGEMGDSHVGLHARLMSQALRKLTGSVSKSRTMLIFLNQIRLKIGVMFGNPETTTGGNALKFYASVRMEIRRIGQIKDREEVVGNQTRVKVVKNKLAPPFRQVEFDIMYGEGISKVGELVDLGVKANVVEKSGAWFSYDSTRIGQGRENAKQFLRDHREMADAIEKRVRDQSGVVANSMIADARGRLPTRRTDSPCSMTSGAGSARRHAAAPGRSRADRGGARRAAAALPAVLAHGRRRLAQPRRADLDRRASRRDGRPAVDLRRGGGARPGRHGRRRHDRERRRRAAPQAGRERARHRRRLALRRVPREPDRLRPGGHGDRPHRRTACAGSRSARCCRCPISAERRRNAGRAERCGEHERRAKTQADEQAMPSNAEKDPHDWVTGDETMTGAQASYLKTLSEEAGEAFDPKLTKADASLRIDELQKKTGRGKDH